MNTADIYKSVAEYCPDHFRAFLYNRDTNCKGCVNYICGEIDGVPTRGCSAGINLAWALENECDERIELQTTIFEVMK